MNFLVRAKNITHVIAVAIVAAAGYLDTHQAETQAAIHWIATHPITSVSGAAGLLVGAFYHPSQKTGA